MMVLQMLGLLGQLLMFVSVSFLFLNGTRATRQHFESKIALMYLIYSEDIYKATPFDHPRKKEMWDQYEQAKREAMALLDKHYPLYSGIRHEFKVKRLKHPYDDQVRLKVVQESS